MLNKNDDPMHPDDMKNLLTFIIAAVVVWVSFDHFLLRPRMEAMEAARKQQQIAASVPTGETATARELRPRQEVLPESDRIRIETDRLTGSISLNGGRIDDLALREYFQTMEKIRSVNMFSPMGSYHPRYAAFGWTDAAKKIRTPDKDTKWSVVGGGNTVLRPNQPVTLYWDNGQGLRFENEILLDDKYLFTVTQRVINKNAGNITLYPYTALAQHGLPEELYNRWTIHEGPIGYIKGELQEITYKKMKDVGFKEFQSDEGWLGLTEHYWLSGMFPASDTPGTYRFVYVPPEKAGNGQARYQVDIMGAGRTLNSGESFETATRIFVGPKQLSILEGYAEQFGWNHIDLAIDFGMWYFLTKPLYYLLHWLGDIAGNFGIGIILLTFVVRIFVFPLANTSFRSFAKLRQVAPEMSKLREKYGDDKQKLQQALVKLYEKEKVNPMAGCLPILIQIPIFFSLFKVLQLSVEMRHAPFYGWIKDLSAPDPTSIFNLFGLLPWDPPAQLMIGIWPCLMLIFMIMQKAMSPPPQDKTQKMMRNIMPFFIVYIMAGFPAGLVIYWTFSNALSVLQQYVIMKSMGVEPHIFKSKEEKEFERQIEEGPTVHPELEVIEHDVEEALFGEELEDADAAEEGQEKKTAKKAAKKAATKKEAKPVSKPKPKKSKKKK